MGKQRITEEFPTKEMEQTEKEELAVFPFETPITINYRVIKSGHTNTVNKEPRRSCGRGSPVQVHVG